MGQLVIAYSINIFKKINKLGWLKVRERALRSAGRGGLTGEGGGRADGAAEDLPRHPDS